ncbi:uncharacterized protein si:dkey-92i15.4 [Conger conger]|uniref:uncharacterized protein si:dkey-92i15.4 n=1 Tax=Conger conger TaxID=82655 RepID=UPI002A5984C1|nr:uncharacterized protein si:dkey-92i15.4 [Conger conger]XP_061118192.1 uncharacterized protein si:dkey-92i15.4 [Conger conger]
MDLSQGSTVLPESSKSPCTLPKPSAGTTHAPTPVDAEQVMKSPSPKTQALPTAGLEWSAAPKFNIRSFKSLSLDLGTPNKQKNLRKLVNIFEAPEAGTGTESNRRSQLDGQQGALDHMSQGDQSEQGTGRRGRSEWRQNSVSNRSKSLDWRCGVSDVGKGERIGTQGLPENCGGLPRRSESFERDGGGDIGKNMSTPTTKKLDQSCTSVSSRIKEYNSGEKVEPKNLKTVPVDQQFILGRSRPGSLQTASRGQSLPSRIKLRLSDSEVGGDVSVWGLHQNGTRTAGDLSSNNTILDRIEKLYGSTTSDMSPKHDAGSVDRLKAKRNSVPVVDWLLNRKEGELSQWRSSTSQNPAPDSESSRQWIGMPYERGQGGTFPRRYSKGEKENSATGSTWDSRNGNDGSDISSLRNPNIVKAGQERSGDRVSGRLQQTQTSLAERDQSVSRLLDRGRHSQTFSVTTRSVMSTPKVASPQQQVQFPVDGTAVCVRDLPQAIQSKAVTDGQEKERECKIGKGEIKTDVVPDLDPGREEKRNMTWHEGGFCDGETERKLGKHEESEQNCNINKETKPLKATTACERSPTVKYCGTLDSPAELFPKMNLASVAQPANTALDGVNTDSKQDLVDCPGGRPEHSLHRPTFKSLEPTNVRGHKEQGKGEDDDVFRLNSPLRVLGNRSNGEAKTGVASTSLANVRSKIDRFETLSQQNRSIPPYHLLRSRRALSEPEHHMEVLGVKKSDSDRTLGGIRGQGAVGFGPKQCFKKEGGGEAVEGGRRKWEVRSLSMDGVRRRIDGRDVLRGGISCPQQTKWSAYKEPPYNSTINTEQSKDCKASSDEPDSSMASQPETKHGLGRQGEISKPLSAKDTMPILQINCNNSNGFDGVTGITNTSGKNACHSINISETDEGDKTFINSASRSPFISSNNSDGTSVSIYPDQVSKRGPQASTQSTTKAAATPVYMTNNVPSTSSTPAPESAPNHSLPHLATSSSSNDPQLYSGVTQNQNQNQVKGHKDPFCMARWSSDEDLWGDDDDDDEGTEKGSNYDSDSGESSVTITSNMSQSDRLSFSVSLADLCNFGGMEYTGHDDDMDLDERMSQRTASLSSDISAFSSISVLPAEELDRLVEEVRGLGDDTLKNYEDVQVVVLHKEVGCGLGFTVAGGVDQNKPITVHKVFPFGLASQEGSMREGDRVLSINGTALKHSAHWEALRTLRRARSRGMAVVVLQKGGATEKRKNAAGSPQAGAEQHTVRNGVRRIRVVLNKFSTDLGFSLEGGLGSNMGDRPLTVKKLFQGGPVEDVFPGDELLEVEGQGMQGLRRLEAWNLIKKLPPGPVEVVLNRPFRPQ